MTSGTDHAAKPTLRTCIDLYSEREGLAAALCRFTTSLHGEPTLIDDLRAAQWGTDPGEVADQLDIQLRAIIRAAQQARKLLRAKED